MRTRIVAFALISAASWLAACGTDAVDSTAHEKDAGSAGSSSTGSGGASGHGGSSVAMAGGGNGGSAVGGSGGNGGSASANGGSAGSAPVVDSGPLPSLCDGKAKKALPYNIISDYRAVTVIGTAATFTIAANPDCTTPYPALEAGTDAASSDSTDETTTLALDDPDAADAATADVTAADVSASDATAATDAGTSDAAPVDAGPPPPACYEFHYDPGLCEAAACWAGVIFQPGAAAPPADAAVQTSSGICIETGATGVEFMARANRDMARVKFGSTREGVGQTEFWTNITTQWAKYTVAIPALEPYNESAVTTGGVWNGFSVVVEPGDHTGGTIISVKDVVWKK